MWPAFSHNNCNATEVYVSRTTKKEVSKSRKRKRKTRKKSRQRKGYPSDLTKAQWKRLRKLIPQSGRYGRPRKYDLKEILNAIFYIVKTGCLWRYLPEGFPHWKTVYTYFRNWRIRGLWEEINNHLRRKIRKSVGKKSQASAAIIDSQSVKTTSVAGKERGYDGGKRIKGRKRHILVDTLGLLMTVVVHLASIQDKEGGLLVLDKMKGLFSRLKVIWADGGYRGAFVEIAKYCFGRKIDIVLRKDKGKGFKVIRKRWIVERTFGWLLNYRRLSKDYERLPETSKAILYIAMTHLMLRRFDRKMDF